MRSLSLAVCVYAIRGRLRGGKLFRICAPGTTQLLSVCARVCRFCAVHPKRESACSALGTAQVLRESAQTVRENVQVLRIWSASPRMRLIRPRGIKSKLLHSRYKAYWKGH
eukprot:92099-Rhodomonas_salina.1